MTRAISERVIKDHESNDNDIVDHIKNHIHLTNCMHIKNHMYKHSPVDNLLRVIQRSRSLRDPSASPPSVLGLCSKNEKNDFMGNGRRSVDVEFFRNNGRAVLGDSPFLVREENKNVGFGMRSYEDSRNIRGKNDTVGIGRRNNEDGCKIREKNANFRVSRRNNEDSPKIREKNNDVGFSRRNNEDGRSIREKNANFGVSKGNNEDGRKIRESSFEKDGALETNNMQRGRQGDVHLRKVSEKMSDDVESSRFLIRENIYKNEQVGQVGGMNRGRRRKFRSSKRSRVVKPSTDYGDQNETSEASNSVGRNSFDPKRLGYGEEVGDNTIRVPKNGCGIPLNWSSIHHRGKSFLDLAGRSLSCGLSEPKSKKSGQDPRKKDTSDVSLTSSPSSSCDKSEETPLLVEALGSQESTGNAAWEHDYSGELGIYANKLLKQGSDSDFASEIGSGVQKYLRSPSSRHQSLTQKYMPRTFRELVGQNLVAQALSNAIVKRKIGLLYVFYGSHGTGKKSAARIFARALNCQSSEQPKPCGFCNSCTTFDLGKSRNIREISAVSSNFGSERIMDLLDNKTLTHVPCQYKVFIVNDCDTLSADFWSIISKVIDRAPRGSVFVLVSSSLDVLPHMVLSRCQKFFFPKLKDADIIYALQWIAAKEELEIDKDALKLIASRSDGSLRDAEMTLEQLSLLGEKISVPLVQEMVGLVSDEKLVDLLDLALSADTINTVKNLRELMESGVEPLALMSQLATVITDILAGSYDLSKEKPRRKFFCKQSLSKEDMEKLRQALKTLSEAEKQLRTSNDRVTWLTAALLQLAPDQHYMLPSSSAYTSCIHSPLAPTNPGRQVRTRTGTVDYTEMSCSERGTSRVKQVASKWDSDAHCNIEAQGCIRDRRKHDVSGKRSKETSLSADTKKASGRLSYSRVCKEVDHVWLAVLDNIQIDSIREFMYQEGKLISFNYGAASTVQLTFSSHQTKSRAEKFRTHILQAFESVLGSPVTIEIRCEPRKGGVNVPLMLPASHDGSSQMVSNPALGDIYTKGYLGQVKSEIAEISSAHDPDGEAEASNNELGTSLPEKRSLGAANRNMSLVRTKVSLAHFIQQAERGSQGSGWSKNKAVSIAEKLEQQNLKLEPRSRSLLCWKASRVTHRKISRLKIGTRKRQTLLKFISCGKCFSSKSPR